jgi:diguanylate cyclase (GGDEF)-like protein
MCLNGHAFRYLWPDSPSIANQANPVLASLWVLTTAGFARLFLESTPRAPKTSRVLDGLIVLGAVSTVLAFAASYRPAMVFASGAALLDALLLLVCGAIYWSRGVRAARFFTLAWVGLGVGTINLAVSRFGLMPDNSFTRNGALLGGVFEIVLLSLALSDKYRLMQIQLEGYSRGLESMVDERTHQLETANASLRKLATVDSLTGVSNRRHFEEHLEKEVRRHRRIAMPLSLVMIDIDHFKEFNDRYGHPRGDECLRQVAEAIASVARRPGDLVARYGGEEFAVLLPHTDRDGARAIGEGIRQAVAALRLSAAAGPEERVAVSVGLTSRAVDGQGSGEELVEEADRALYEAKRSGRDRMVQGKDVA